MPDSQPDLFGKIPIAREETASATPMQVPPEFVNRIRDELTATLDTVRRAETLPWPDLTKTTLAELRFNSIARWLPEDEAAELRRAFDLEMARLYDAEDRRAEAG
jgi:hypothetical protein